jgi:hypothetical protein
VTFNSYVIGSSVTVTGTYTNNATGGLTDPTDAKVDVVSPNGQITTYIWNGGLGAVRKVSTGIFAYDIDTTGLPGRWQYRWWSPPGSPVQTAGRSEFYVTPFPQQTP